MCGIVCRVGVKIDNFSDSLSVINHRGPDSLRNMSFKLSSTRQLDIGHVRLSILDLDTRSNQPFTLDNEHFLAFNGEIYNYLELAEKYLSDVKLTTQSDTEVLWLLLVHYGLELLEELIGMFSFVFYNTRSNSLQIARDFLGIKPLYIYSNDSDELVFASEIKAIEALGIKPLVCPEDIPEYIQFGYLHEPSTGFSNIKKVQPGEIINVSLDNLKFSRRCISFGDVGDDSARDIISKSISIHQRADVKQALFFSGGIDSSLLLSSMDRDQVQPVIMSYNQNEVANAGFSDDSHYAKLIIENQGMSASYIELPGSSTSFIDSLEQMAEGIEELIADYTYVASYRLSEAVRQQGFLVAHSGMGADELFGGYPRYLAFNILNKLGSLSKFILPFLVFYNQKKAGRLISAINAETPWDRYFSLISSFSDKEIRSILTSSQYANLQKKKEEIWVKSQLESDLKTAMNTDRIGFLSHNFIVADKSSMKASIEMRVPLANQNTYRWFLSAKENQLINRSTTKVTLRKMLYERIDRKFFKRSKAGFNPPIDDLVNAIGKKVVLETLSKDLTNYIRFEEVNNIVTRHFERVENNSYKILNLLYLSVWLKKYS